MGRRYEWQILVDGGYGRLPCGWRSMSGKEVGSRCDRELLQLRMATDGGGGG